MASYILEILPEYFKSYIMIFLTTSSRIAKFIIDQLTSFGCIGKVRRSLENDWKTFQIYFQIVLRHLEIQFFHENGLSIDTSSVMNNCCSELDEIDSKLTVHLLKIFDEEEIVLAKFDNLLPVTFINSIWLKLDSVKNCFKVLGNLSPFS